LFIIRLDKKESEMIHQAVNSGKEVPFLRSDSDNNTFNAFSTPSTLCSESERKERDLTAYESGLHLKKGNA
jgi:hypothetical protein